MYIKKLFINIRVKKKYYTIYFKKKKNIQIIKIYQVNI